jgi:hypothetical protein
VIYLFAAEEAFSDDEGAAGGGGAELAVAAAAAAAELPSELEGLERLLGGMPWCAEARRLPISTQIS